MIQGDSMGIQAASMGIQAVSTGDLVILGGGGQAAVVAESAARAGWRVVGFAAAVAATAATDVATLGDPDCAMTGGPRIEAMIAQGARLHAAVGAAEVRERWFSRFGAANFASVVDPSAVISPSAHVGAGVYIGVGAVVNARAAIEAGAIINTRAIVEHDCTVGAFSHIAPAAVLCGSVRVGRCAQVSAGAVVIPVRRIGDGAMVGAGAVVVRDVPAGMTVAGVPAMPLPPKR